MLIKYKLKNGQGTVNEINYEGEYLNWKKNGYGKIIEIMKKLL